MQPVQYDDQHTIVIMIYNPTIVVRKICVKNISFLKKFVFKYFVVDAYPRKFFDNKIVFNL